MCDFFSSVAACNNEELRLLFTEETSHEEIIKRAKLRDIDVFLRDFVRLEILPPFDIVTVDEEGTLPVWFEDRRIEIETKVLTLARRVAPLYADYEAKRDTLYADYKAKLQKIDGYIALS